MLKPKDKGDLLSTSTATEKPKKKGNLTIKILLVVLLLFILGAVFVFVTPHENTATPMTNVHDIGDKADLVSNDGQFDFNDKVMKTNLNKQPVKKQPSQVSTTKSGPVDNQYQEDNGKGYSKPMMVSWEPSSQGGSTAPDNTPPSNTYTAPISTYAAPAASPMNSKRILSGSTIPAELLYSLQTDKPQNPITAVLTRDFVKGGIVLLPKSAKLAGLVTEVSNNGRIFISFNRILLPNGEEKEFRGEGMDIDLSIGLAGEVLNNSSKYAGVAAEVVVAAGLDSMSQTNSTIISNGVVVTTPTSPSFGNSLGKIGGDVVGNMAKSQASTIAQQPSVYRVPQGKQLYVYIRETLNL